MNLNNSVGKLPFIGPTYILRLEKLGINTIEDLLYHVPKRYKDFRITSDVSRVQLGEKITIQGKLESFKNIYTKAGKVFQKASISDKTGQIQAIWFNQRYLARTFIVGETYSFSGKIDPAAMFGECGAMERLVPLTPHSLKEVVPFLEKTFPNGEFLDAVQNDLIVEWSNKTIVELMKRKLIAPLFNVPYDSIKSRIDAAPKVDFTAFATALAMRMFILCASLPLVLLVPSGRKTIC